ncbi:hypothetical protein CL622_03855 [archaeon]|nr:hypothetical protein [archaeon]
MLCGLFYSSIPNDRLYTPFDYHLALAQTILSGDLSVENPSNTHDLALYQQNYYLPWGITPALLLIPFRLVFQSQTNGMMLMIPILFVSLFVWLAIYRQLRTRRWVNLTNHQIILFSLLTTFGTLFYYIVTNGGVWFISQAITFLFMSLSLLFLIKQGNNTKLVSSVFFALSFLTRNVIAIFLIPYYGLLFYFDRKERQPNSSLSFVRVILLLLPLVIAIFFQLGYNDVRFDDPLESGYSYQQVAPRFVSDIETHGILSSYYTAHNLKIYLFNPVYYDLQSPYLHFDYEGNSFWSYQLYFWIIVIALGVLLHTSMRVKHKNRYLLTVITNQKKMFIVGLISMWVLFFAFVQFTIGTGWRQFGSRYLLDVEPFILLLTVFSFDYIKKNQLIRYVSYALIVLSIIIAVYAKRLFNGF